MEYYPSFALVKQNYVQIQLEYIVNLKLNL